MNPVDLASAALDAPPGDFSLISLFFQADIVVQLVMIGLLFSSIWCWAIIFEKMFSIARTRRMITRFEKIFWSGQSLEELYKTLGHRAQQGTAALFIAAMREWKRSQETGQRPAFGGLLQRLEKVMDVTIQREMARLESRLMFLATVGATAPFVGLFGTVWGIMNSFQAIAISKNTNLAVVAPGIAEALFATALGLLAAIPAVVAYNKFTTDLARVAGRMENFADEFAAILSRQIDERR